MFLPYAQPYPATPRSVNVQFSYNAIAFNRKTLDIKGRL